MNAHVGLDVSTQGTTAGVLIADTGDFVVGDPVPHRTFGVAGSLLQEQPPDQYAPAVAGALSNVMKKVPEGTTVRTVGVSAMQHTLFFHRHGQPVTNAWTWQDGRASEVAALVRNILGWAAPAGLAGPKAIWASRHLPGLFCGSVTCDVLASRIVHQLTGVRGLHPSEAGAQGLRFTDGTFDSAQLAAVHANFKRMLPPVVEADGVAGLLLPEYSASCGRTDGSSPLCSYALADNAASLIAATGLRLGSAAVSAGSSATLCMRAAHAVFDEEGIVLPFVTATGEPQPLACVSNCGLVVNHFVDALIDKRWGASSESERVIRRRVIFRELEDALLAGRVPVGGGQGVCLPFRDPERLPPISVPRYVLEGLTPAEQEDPAVEFALILQGVVVLLKKGLEKMALLGAPASEVSLAGGIARNKWFRQLVADILQLPVRVPKAPPSQMAVMGAALHGMWCGQDTQSLEELAAQYCQFEDGEIKPNPETQTAYEAAQARFNESLQRNFGV